MALSKIEKRIQEQKEALIKEFEQTPNISISCKRIGIGRATYYRWTQESEEFLSEAEKARWIGIEYVNDICESSLVALIQEKNILAIKYWLEHNSWRYRSVEESGKPTRIPVYEIC